MSEDNGTLDNPVLEATLDEENIEENQPAPALSATNRSHLLTAILGTVLFIAVFMGALFIELPLYTYEAEKRTYSRFAIAKASLAVTMVEREKERVAEEFGIDFSRLLVPENMESTKAMQAVAATCLASGAYTLYALPPGAHNAFSQATDYLACALKNNEARLCQTYQKQRLVEQLMEYLDIRQHMIAMEQTRFDVLGDNSATGIYPKLDKKLDRRIGIGLKELTQKGYLSGTDFGWYGLALPEKYAPYIARNVTQESMCS